MEGWLGDARTRDEFAALADRAVVAYNERFWDDALGAYSVRPQPVPRGPRGAHACECTARGTRRSAVARRWAGARADYSARADGGRVCRTGST